MYNWQSPFNKDGSLSNNTQSMEQSSPFTTGAFYNWLLTNTEQMHAFQNRMPPSPLPPTMNPYLSPFMPPPMFPVQNMNTSPNSAIPSVSALPPKRPDDNSLDITKKKRRQEQNRVSARESRRKRKEYISNIETKVKELEDENKRLKSIIEQSVPKQNPERIMQRQQILNKLQTMLIKGASNDELIKIITLFKCHYSAYGTNNFSETRFYIDKLFNCMMPSKTTSFCLYLLMNNIQNIENHEDFFRSMPDAPDPEGGMGDLQRERDILKQKEEKMREILKKEIGDDSLEKEEHIHDNTNNNNNNNNTNNNSNNNNSNNNNVEWDHVHVNINLKKEKGIEEKREKETNDETDKHRMDLWNLMCSELELTKDQEDKIIETKPKLRSIIEKFHKSANYLEKLNEILIDKNNSLDSYIDELQEILTPIQVVKYVLWAHCYTNNESLASFVNSNKISQIQHMIKTGEEQDMLSVCQPISKSKDSSINMNNLKSNYSMNNTASNSNNSISNSMNNSASNSVNNSASNSVNNSPVPISGPVSTNDTNDSSYSDSSSYSRENDIDIDKV
ncbi:hypothetical protein WA158_004035 [Blastocystis sp. Blastoise]